MKQLQIFAIALLVCCASLLGAQDESYLSWNDQYCLSTGKAMIANGRVGGFWDMRVKHTERSYNYKLRATWLTPDVIRAAARLQQIKNRLTAEQSAALVAEAEAAGDTVVLVEIDPREGSGVIPLEWQAWLQPKGTQEGQEGAVSGINCPALRRVKALAGVAQRDYDYDLFWLVFPLTYDSKPVFSDSMNQAELILHIYNKEGHVEWAIPSSIHQRTTQLLNGGGAEVR